MAAPRHPLRARRDHQHAGAADAHPIDDPLPRRAAEARGGHGEVVDPHRRRTRRGGAPHGRVHPGRGRDRRSVARRVGGRGGAHRGGGAVRDRPRSGGADYQGGASNNVRWVLLHLVEEMARHAGHADLLREAIDGRTYRR
ncbi:DUF664 domain-containing protein [Allobranchiibius sp. GilTou38]|nr:DUF664 domain-containing protein [Allobranchiibius sp. GilTou38]